ncbi:MAG: hypothetical protein F4045_08790 [Chloroflexi bacterium]|nr:hypothetical protein [Chloroflexota bacterium]MYK35180.1 hypothetical protein [Chloroflexota bacterium]
MTSYWDQWQKERQEVAERNGFADDFVEANTVVLTAMFRALLKYAPETTTDSVYELALPVMEERGTNNPIVGMFVGHVLNLMIEDKED